MQSEMTRSTNVDKRTAIKMQVEIEVDRQLEMMEEESWYRKKETIHCRFYMTKATKICIVAIYLHNHKINK